MAVRLSVAIAALGTIPLAATALLGGVSSASSARAVACTNLSHATLAHLPTHGVLRGDMNGDGRKDRVSIAVNRRAPLACRYILVAELGKQVVTGYVRQPYLNEQHGDPRLDVLARVNRGKGAQAIISFGIGAAVDFHGLYALDQGRLVRMKVLPRDPKSEGWDTFGQGASNAGGMVSYCADGPGSGTVLVVGTSFKLGVYRLSTTGGLYVQHDESYRLVSGSHRLTKAERANANKWPPGLRPAIFANCAIAAA